MSSTDSRGAGSARGWARAAFFAGLVMLVVACGSSRNAVITQQVLPSTTATQQDSSPRLITPDGYVPRLSGVFRSDVPEASRSAFAQQLIQGAKPGVSAYAVDYDEAGGRVVISWPGEPSETVLTAMEDQLRQSRLFSSVSRSSG